MHTTSRSRTAPATSQGGRLLFTSGKSRAGRNPWASPKVYARGGGGGTGSAGALRRRFMMAAASISNHAAKPILHPKCEIEPGEIAPNNITGKEIQYPHFRK